MKYIQKYHKIQPKAGCSIHMVNDWGYKTEDNKYCPPALSSEICLAINLSKEQAFELYEDIELDKIDEYKKIWKQKIREQEQLEQQENEEVLEPELEDFEEDG